MCLIPGTHPERVFDTVGNGVTGHQLPERTVCVTATEDVSFEFTGPGEDLPHLRVFMDLRLSDFVVIPATCQRKSKEGGASLTYRMSTATSQDSVVY